MNNEDVHVTGLHEYYEEIRIIVRALGHKSVFFTDESQISDFLPTFGKDWKECRNFTIKQAIKKIKTDLKPTDKLIKIAKRLRRDNKKKENQNENR